MPRDAPGPAEAPATPQASGGRSGQLASSGLRPGWTSGACASAAARSAYLALVTGEFADPVTVDLPHDRHPAFALTAESLSGDSAMAAVTKDAGDDPDVTHLAVVRVRLSRGSPGTGLRFVAGKGVGTVTMPGLPLAVGEPAINPGPRRMIGANLRTAAATVGRASDPLDLVVEVGIDGGAELALHTLNPRVGIVGGLSVLGTTGVVVPYSCSAWIDSIRRGIDVAVATGVRHVAACTGSTSERVATQLYGLRPVALLDMGDFAGAVLKYLRRHPIPRLSIVGGFAKLTKLAEGHLDLHSGRSQVNPAHLVAIAERAGAGADLNRRIAEAGTALGALHAAQAEGFGLGNAVAVAARSAALAVLGGVPIAVDVVCIDRAGDIVGRCDPSPMKDDEREVR